MIKLKDLKLFHVYKVYSNGRSIEEIAIPIEKTQDNFIGVLDEEYFNKDMNGVYINYMVASNLITYEEFETEFPEKYIKFIFGGLQK